MSTYEKRVAFWRLFWMTVDNIHIWFVRRWLNTSTSIAMWWAHTFHYKVCECCGDEISYWEDCSCAYQQCDHCAD
jgi:hypothetical protein